MQDLFELIKKQSHSEDADIIEIQKDLAAETPEGAFYANMERLEKSIICIHV